jgi:cytochrome c oxidase assembly protein subunit 15
MTLDEFKNIFFWEYTHRLIGRAIGVWFAVPFFYFMARGKIPKSLTPKLWAMLAMGGFQVCSNV